MKFFHIKQMKRGMQVILACVCVLLFFPVAASAQASGEPDYNREFIDNFFAEPDSGSTTGSGIGEAADESAGLRIQRDPDEEKASGDDDDDEGVSISTLGKILQISLVLLLAALIYVQSQRSKRRSRF